MLAWLAAFLFAFGALSNAEGIASSSSLLSWPVLACAGMALLAMDQAMRQRDRKARRSSDEEVQP
jgi:uncharacterized membrane protein